MKKNITIGIFLIVIAVLMVVSKLGLLQNLPVFKILFTVILGIIAIKGIFNFKFAEIFIPLALIGCIFDRELGITAITPWILIIASILISIGLDMIFKDFRYKIKMNGNKESSFSDDTTENNDRVVFVNCSFGTTNKYVNSDSFKRAKIKNKFASCNVYFDNAFIAGKSADIYVNNSFGETTLHFPSDWKLNVKKSNAFGNLRVNGNSNMSDDAKIINVYAENSFGTVVIIFD